MCHEEIGRVGRVGRGCHGDDSDLSATSRARRASWNLENDTTLVQTGSTVHRIKLSADQSGKLKGAPDCPTCSTRATSSKIPREYATGMLRGCYEETALVEYKLYVTTTTARVRRPSYTRGHRVKNAGRGGCFLLVTYFCCINVNTRQSDLYTSKYIHISTDILWRVFHILTEPVP